MMHENSKYVINKQNKILILEQTKLNSHIRTNKNPSGFGEMMLLHV